MVAIADINVFPARVRNWDTLNTLAQRMFQVGATNEAHAIPAGKLIEALDLNSKSAYRVLREAVGFAPVRDQRSGALSYYLEAEKLREFFSESMGADFYPKSFNTKTAITNVDCIAHAEKIRELEQELTTAKISTGPKIDMAFKLADDADITVAFKIKNAPQPPSPELLSIFRDAVDSGNIEAARAAVGGLVLNTALMAKSIKELSSNG